MKNKAKQLAKISGTSISHSPSTQEVYVPLQGFRNEPKQYF